MSDQEVRWCPGCGDYSILAQTQKVMPDFGYPKENIVFISGHRLLRPPAVLHEHVRLPHDPRPGARPWRPGSRRPARTSWSGSSPATATRSRSAATTCSTRCAATSTSRSIMFNNRIYGLTKGQASPTSELGKITKSSPWARSTPDQPAVRGARGRGDASSPARSTPTPSTSSRRSSGPASTRARRSSRSSRTATSSTTARGATSPTARSARTGCSSWSTASR